MAAGGQRLAIQHCALSAKTQAAFGKPAYSQRIDLVFLLMHAARKAFGRVVCHDWQHSLYDQRATIEFLGDEVHAAAVFAVAGFDSSLMSVQAFVLGQQ